MYINVYDLFFPSGWLLSLCSLICERKLEKWGRKLFCSFSQILPWPGLDSSLGWRTQVWNINTANLIYLVVLSGLKKIFKGICCFMIYRCIKVSSFGSLSHFRKENKVWLNWKMVLYNVCSAMAAYGASGAGHLYHPFNRY